MSAREEEGATEDQVEDVSEEGSDSGSGSGTDAGSGSGSPSGSSASNYDSPGSTDSDDSSESDGGGIQGNGQYEVKKKSKEDSESDDNSYLRARKRNIARNNARLAELGFGPKEDKSAPRKDQVKRKKKKKSTPTKKMPDRRAKSGNQRPSRSLRASSTSTFSKQAVSESSCSSSSTSRTLAVELFPTGSYSTDSEEETTVNSEKKKKRRRRRTKGKKKKKKEFCSGPGNISKPKKPRKSRAKEKAHLNNDCMKKNRLGKVVISKLSYDPEKKIDETTISNLLGIEGMRLSKQRREEVEGWFKELKEQAGRKCRLKIIDEVVDNAGTLGYPWYCIEDIQDAWAAALDHESRVTVGQKILKCLSVGYFADREDSLNPNWKYVMEKELLKTFNLAYLSDDGEEDGCLSKQASRSRADVVKRLERKGRKLHDYIASKRAKKGEKRKKRKPNDEDDDSIIECYVRKAGSGSTLDRRGSSYNTSTGSTGTRSTGDTSNEKGREKKGAPLKRDSQDSQSRTSNQRPVRRNVIVLDFC